MTEQRLIPYVPFAGIAVEDGTASCSAERAKRYRQRHPRIDFKPSEESLAIIERNIAMHQGISVSAVLDALILRADQGVTGNVAKQQQDKAANFGSAD